MSPAPVGTCKLCRQRAKLNYSHILPEFLYLETYDHKHRAVKVSATSAREDYPQKGEREYLLCDDCERRFSKYEHYAAPIIKSIPALPRDKSGQFLLTAPVDYAKFKLFQLSLLWRASVSTLPMFQEVSLGVRQERLRRTLLHDKPGKPHYLGCIMIALQNTKYLHRIIWSPVKDTVDGRTCFRFQTGGIFWYYFTSSFPKNHPFRNVFLSEVGELKVAVAPWSESEVVSRIAGLIAGRPGASQTQGA